jgi:hypothetical protein
VSLHSTLTTTSDHISGMTVLTDVAHLLLQAAILYLSMLMNREMAYCSLNGLTVLVDVKHY